MRSQTAPTNRLSCVCDRSSFITYKFQTDTASYRGITLLSLPGKVYSKVLERKVQPIIKSRIEEEQCGFHPGHETSDHLARASEGAREFVQPGYMCFVDMERAYDQIPWDILWEVQQEYWARGSLLKAIQSLYVQSESCVWILGSNLDLFLVGLASARVAPCNQSFL